jgi:hypothetical protein
MERTAATATATTGKMEGREIRRRWSRREEVRRITP